MEALVKLVILHIFNNSYDYDKLHKKLIKLMNHDIFKLLIRKINRIPRHFYRLSFIEFL